MIDLLERSLGPRVELRLDIPQGLPPARIDANQLELAILNLAINARDAMPDGGRIDIRVAEYQAKQRCRRWRPGRYLKLSVVDTGSGMSPEILKRAIEPFFSSKPVGKGTGLGLSMVHGLAVQLGGALQLTSTVGKGTCATLVLPVATVAPEAESPAPVAEKIKRSAVILFVDDDPLIAMSTTEMLEDLGHRVIGANSGQHALDILKSEQPLDLMVTDHMMPGMTGLELAAASREVRPSLPVLLATGYAELPEGHAARPAASGKALSPGPVARSARSIAGVTPLGAYPTIRSRPVQKPAFSTFLSTLPTPVIGSSVDELDVLGRMRRALARLHQVDQFVRVRLGAFARARPRR